MSAGAVLEVLELPRLGLSFTVEPPGGPGRPPRVASRDHAGFAVAASLSRAQAALLAGFPMGLPLVGGPLGSRMLVVAPSYPCQRVVVSTAPFTTLLLPALRPARLGARRFGINTDAFGDLEIQALAASEGRGGGNSGDDEEESGGGGSSITAWAYVVHPSALFVSPPPGVGSCVPAVLAATHLLLLRRYAAAASMLRLAPANEPVSLATLQALARIRSNALSPMAGGADSHPDAIGVRLQMATAAMRLFLGVLTPATVARCEGSRAGKFAPRTHARIKLRHDINDRSSDEPHLGAALAVGDGDPGGRREAALLSFAGSWGGGAAVREYSAYLAAAAHVSPPCRLSEADEALLVAACSSVAYSAGRSLSTSLGEDGAGVGYEAGAASLLQPSLRARDAFLAALQVRY